MSKISQDSDVGVTFEDQQKINKFARVNARLQDIKEDLESKQKDMENLDDAENEIMMAEDDSSFPYMVGEVLVHCSQDDTNKMLEEAKNQLSQEIKTMEGKAEDYKKILSDLKVQLYAKFGNNINLEAEDE